MGADILTFATEAAIETPPPVESPDTELETTESTAESAEQRTEPIEEGQEELKAGETPTPQKIRDALKALKDASPENAKIANVLKDAYGRAEAIKQVFPGGIQEARQFKSTVDSFGGVEAITNMQHLASSVEATDAQLAAGDPAVLDDLVKDFGEGLVKLAPHYLDRIQRQNPEAFTATIQPHAINYLMQNRFGDVVDYMDRALAAGDVKGATESLKSVKEWLAQQTDVAQKAKQPQAQNNEETQKLRQQLQERDEKEFRQNVSNESLSHRNKELGSRLKGYLNASMSQGQKEDVARAVITEWQRQLSSDKAFQSQIKALREAKNRDPKRISSLINSKTSMIADAVIRATVQKYNLKPGARGKATPAAKPSAQTGNVSRGTPIKIAAMPSPDSVDWDKTTEEMIVQGQRILKDGRFVAHR